MSLKYLPEPAQPVGPNVLPPGSDWISALDGAS
jgi:hypothetical protein